ncbi:MAG TPA: hypothetical protein VGF45_24010 [Polyangia bacterium]
MRARYLAFAGLFGLTALACEQKEGERCEIDTDCASDLTCEGTVGNGICRRRSGTTTPDGGGTPDAMTPSPDVSLDTRVETGGPADTADSSGAADVPADVPVPVDVPRETGPDVSLPDATPDTGDARVDQAG